MTPTLTILVILNFIALIIFIYLNRNLFFPDKGQPDQPNIQEAISNDWKVRVGVHEMGHAICAFACLDVNPKSVKALIHSSYDRGRVKFSYDIACMHLEFFPWYEVITSLGGIAAELTFYKSCNTSYVKSDLVTAINAANKMLTNKKVFSLEPPVNMKKCVEVKPPNFVKLYREGSITNEEVEILNIGYRIAKTIVMSNKSRCYEFGLKLSEERLISSDEFKNAGFVKNKPVFSSFLKHRILL